MSLRELPIYKEDWIGLKQLDQRGSLLQIKLPGEHVWDHVYFVLLIFLLFMFNLVEYQSGRY